MKMLQQRNGQPVVKKISKQWTSYNSMLFGIILLLGCLGPSSTQPVSPANLINLKNKVELFHAKYNATLLDSTFLPFLKDCSEVFNKSPEKMSYTDRLCITYYDMINSIYHLNEFENSNSVTKILEEYNGESMTEHFCKEFPGEIIARLEKQPFAEAMNITNWLKLNDCVVSCLVKDNKTVSKWRILDICKLISGGLSMAVNKSKIENDMTFTKETSTAYSNSNNNNTNTVNDQSNKTVSDEPTNANEPTKIEEKTIGTPQQKHKIIQAVQSNKDDKQPKDLIAADGEDSEQNNDTKTYDIPDNDDTADEAGNHSEDGQHETPLETNSNNLQSPLSANINEFREDNESSFFSYFMFFMFVIITFYVAYHNKSKILALLIEGRRGRTYSSRGGSRRKSHSAEYRKLDCNLEEAMALKHTPILFVNSNTNAAHRDAQN